MCSFSTKHNPKIKIQENLRYRLNEDAKRWRYDIAILLQNHRQADDDFVIKSKHYNLIFWRLHLVYILDFPIIIVFPIINDTFSNCRLVLDYV